MKLFKYLSIDYWRYVFKDATSVSNVICRIKGHPNGVVWYTSPEATEPDYHCQDCGEYIG